MAKKNDAAFYAYNCEHGASNKPDACFPRDAEPMPDDWMKDYEAPLVEGGITDSVAI